LKLQDVGVLQRLGFPEVGPHRRFVAALALDAIGSGIWMPLSMLYFLHQTSLGLVRLGLAMTIANTLVIPLVAYLGALVDRVGPKRVIQLGNAGAAMAFVLYPFAHSLAAVTVLVFAASLTRTAFWSALGPMVTQITEPGERELWFGFVQAMRNAGFGIGGVLAAVALTIGTDAAYQSVVLGNAVSYVAAFALMVGVAGGGRAAAARADRSSPWVAFGDRAYRVLVAVILCYALTGTTLSIAMPVYFVDGLGLPGWMPGTVYVINTVMIGVGQGLVVRRMTGVVRRRVLQAAVAFTAVSYLLLWSADLVTVEAGVVVVLVGAVVYTLGELTAGPVVAALSAEAAPSAQRGRFMAATQLAWSVASAIGPLLWSFLLARGAWAAWGASLVLCVVWSGLVHVLGARMPLAGRAVTNLAEGAETTAADPAAEAPTIP
jgi:MFS family permease